jgi:hypothetical protein
MKERLYQSESRIEVLIQAMNSALPNLGIASYLKLDDY